MEHEDGVGPTMSERYKPFDFKGDYNAYARERDEHLYQLWKQGATKGWIASYIDRSRERARQLVRKFEARAKAEEAAAQSPRRA